MENIRDTVYDFALVLRQHYTESILREKLLSVGASYHASTECVDFDIVDAADYGVTSYFVNRITQEPMALKRYI